MVNWRDWDWGLCMPYGMTNNKIKNMNKNELYISDVLFESLRDWGAIKWHKNENHSFYIKFKDVRLGSIRIANHKGRDRYHYTYEIFKEDKDIERKIDDIVESIKKKAETIRDFDPIRYIVFDKKKRTYKVVKSLEEYKKAIWSR